MDLASPLWRWHLLHEVAHLEACSDNRLGQWASMFHRAWSCGSLEAAKGCLEDFGGRWCRIRGNTLLSFWEMHVD